MDLKVDAEDLVKWNRYLDDIPRVTKTATATALNTFGDGVLREVVNTIAAKNDWEPDEVMSRIVVKEATPRDLEWSMDASLVVPGDEFTRPWPDRDTSQFEQNTLIKIVTMDDGFDCDICRTVAAEGPYTMAQVLDMQQKWADYVPPTPNLAPGVISNLIHPRCSGSADGSGWR